MPSLTRQKDSTGFIIRESSNEIIYYNGEESMFDDRIGDLWCSFDSPQEFAEYINAIWEYTTYDKLSPYVKAVLSLIL